MFTIGMLLFILGWLTASILGSKPFTETNKWDYVGGGLGVAGVILLIISVMVLTWRLLP